MKPFNLLAACIALVLSCAPAARAQDAPTSAPAPAPAPAPAKPKQFLYLLRLASRLHDRTAWSEADTATVGRHFAHLKAATVAGRVILAGRTLEPEAQTFGLVIFDAADEAAARAFMESDPAIVAGVMTATLHPYTIALQRTP